MNTKTLLIGIAAFVGAGLLVITARRSAGTMNGDTERMAGVGQLYASNAGQTAAVNQAVRTNWDTLQRQVFASQPDFWV